MTRKTIVIGNWKMYKTAHEAAAYIEELLPLIEGCQSEVFLAVPFTSIVTAAKAAKGTPVRVGAQNMNDAREGAFTGEIAALMLKEAGADFVLLGHSERRHHFGETDELIQRKVLRALQDDLIPVLCIGETAQERKEGHTEQVLSRQIEQGLSGLPQEELKPLILAYEPVWAIGTSKHATPAMAQETHAFCRKILEDLFGQAKALEIPILYGGSVKPENAGELTSEDDVDGVLVGGASLNAKNFSEIVLNCRLK